MLGNVRVVGFVGATIVALGTQLSAQPQRATIIMNSGERKPALNIGMFDGRELIVRTSFAEEPRIPVDQVAYIDFGGTPDTNVPLSGSQQAVVLRDGMVLQGQVTRISHTKESDQASPFLISFRTTSGEERQLNGNDVARVYFRQPSSAAASVGTAGQNGAASTITVPANQPWTSTGVRVSRGDRIVFTGTGNINFAEGAGKSSGVGGSPDTPGGRLPVANAPLGALIGRVGNGTPFLIGANTGAITMPANGQLMLGINDDHFPDNSGNYTVTIQRSGR